MVSREQEKAIFAGQGGNGKRIRKKQIVKTKIPVVKGTRFKKEWHGDYETTHANGITYHQSKGKINYGTSRSHKDSETCLICRDPDKDEFYEEYEKLQKSAKLKPLTFSDYTKAKQHWDNLPEEKRRNVLATVKGKHPDKIKFTNYRFNDLSHNDQLALLELSKH